MGYACVVSTFKLVEMGCEEGVSYLSSQVSRFPKDRSMSKWILYSSIEKSVSV